MSSTRHFGWNINHETLYRESKQKVWYVMQDAVLQKLILHWDNRHNQHPSCGVYKSDFFSESSMDIPLNSATTFFLLLFYFNFSCIFWTLNSLYIVILLECQLPRLLLAPQLSAWKQVWIHSPSCQGQDGISRWLRDEISHITSWHSNTTPGSARFHFKVLKWSIPEYGCINGS